MRITIVLGAFFPVPPVMGGAIEKTWFVLAQEFARRGHAVVQVSRAFGEFPRDEIIEGVRHVRVRGFDTPRSLVWLKVLDLIYSLRVRATLPPADVIVTNTFWLPMLLRDAGRGRVYVHIARYPKGQMRFYKRAARLQTVSTPIREAIVAEAPAFERKVCVIPYPRPRADETGEAVPWGDRGKTILYVGRVHPEKGVHLLVQAVTEAEPLRDWKLVIVGPADIKHGGGGERYLAQLQAAAQNSLGKVEFRGAVFDSAALAREYGSARIFVYPSLAERGETFGVAPLEAMAHGCAVLVSDLGCFHDFIAEEQTGFFFDHRTERPADTLRAKLCAMAADEILLARVAEAGCRKSDEFSLESVADRYLADFENVVASHV